jgi:hypothetical protein
VDQAGLNRTNNKTRDNLIFDIEGFAVLSLLAIVSVILRVQLIKPFSAVEEDAQYALRPEELNCFFDGFTGSAIRSY